MQTRAYSDDERPSKRVMDGVSTSGIGLKEMVNLNKFYALNQAIQTNTS